MISNGVLKTPIIFILDELFKISFGMPEFINALMAVFWKHFNRLYYGYDDINIYANSTIVLSQPEKSIYEDLLLNSVRTMVCWSSMCSLRRAPSGAFLFNFLFSQYSL